jgi:hypothetical protein
MNLHQRCGQQYGPAMCRLAKGVRPSVLVPPEAEVGVCCTRIAASTLRFLADVHRVKLRGVPD